MGFFKYVILIILIFSLLGDVCYSQDINTIPLKKGATAPCNGLLIPEKDFIELIKWKANYKFEKEEWEIKEVIYKDALKKAEKRMRVPFLKSFKFGFISGVVLIVLSAYAMGQLNK